MKTRPLVLAVSAAMLLPHAALAAFQPLEPHNIMPAMPPSMEDVCHKKLGHISAFLDTTQVPQTLNEVVAHYDSLTALNLEFAESCSTQSAQYRQNAPIPLREASLESFCLGADMLRNITLKTVEEALPVSEDPVNHNMTSNAIRNAMDSVKRAGGCNMGSERLLG